MEQNKKLTEVMAKIQEAKENGKLPFSTKIKDTKPVKTVTREDLSQVMAKLKEIRLKKQEELKAVNKMTLSEHIARLKEKQENKE